jgi:hypothetical protein
MLCGLMVAGFFEQTLYWAVADLPVYRIYLVVFSSVSMYLVGKNRSQTSGRTAGRRGTPAAGCQTGENSESCRGATIATRRFIRIGASG